MGFIDKYILPGNFDIVIMNPDFEYCAAALYLAWAAIRNSKYRDPTVICLCPVTLLNMSEGRKRYYAMTPLFVQYEHQIGKLNYHTDRVDSRRKMMPDSIYIFKILRDYEDFDKKYERIVRDHTAHRTPLTHIMKTKWRNIKKIIFNYKEEIKE